MAKNSSPSVAAAVEEIVGVYRSLPPRPTLEEVAAAMAVVKTSAMEEEAMIEEVKRMEKPPDLADELFQALREMKMNLAKFRGFEQRSEVLRVVDLDNRLQVFDELLQRASKSVSVDDGEVGGDGEERGAAAGFALVQAPRAAGGSSEECKGGFAAGGEEDSSKSEIPAEKLGLIQIANLIEASAKNGDLVLDLQGRLKEQVEWLPLSLGKLVHVTALNLSENRLLALPTSIGSLRFLTKLDLSSNQLINLPHSFGDGLCNLVDLDLHANQLRSLPASFGGLTSLANLDLSTNKLSSVPDSLGNLARLRTLNIKMNELEELPHTIGSCCSLTELRLDFNRLKALPEVIGKLESLRVLTLHYNRVKGLPTTMGSLPRLEELDASFNELELVPESQCLARSIVKLHLGNNFADLTALPVTIGDLEALEELDISNNQIRVLPESFRFLKKLRVLRADELPLEVPPREMLKLGAQAVVQYMDELAAGKIADPSQPAKNGGFCPLLCSLLACFGMEQGRPAEFR